MTVNNAEGAGFRHLLRAEWTKFRTSRSGVIGILVAGLVTVLLGLFSASGSHASCGGPNDICPEVPLGPGGQAVTDKFYFVHRPLVGDGSITARVTSLTGLITYPPPNHDQIVPGVVPWAKAGVIVKESTRQGSAYASVMLTGHHGVRMQYNFTADTPGRPGDVAADSPRWLRLTRAGETLTGYESTDGTQWTAVASVQLTGLPAMVQVGLFVTSPCDLTVEQGPGGGTQCRFTQATVVFDQVSLQGVTPGDGWAEDDIGVTLDGGQPFHPGGVEEAGGTFTVTGNGDIAPAVADGMTIEDTLTGAVAGLIVVIVVAVMWMTAEYRRGVVSPPRLAAKAIVVGTVTFLVGLAAAVVAVQLGSHTLRANGMYILPVTVLTELRVVVGTAALLAVAAVFALAVGALFRRTIPAVIMALALIVLPYTLAIAPFLPVATSNWLLRLTPAAGFAIQQSLPEYPQMTNFYAPQTGYYPLSPWAGFAVLCGYTALALGLAVLLQRRRNA